MKKRYIIDRIEDGIATLENEEGHAEEYPAESMPKGAKEGDCLVFSDEGFVRDEDATKARRERILELRRSLFE